MSGWRLHAVRARVDENTHTHTSSNNAAAASPLAPAACQAARLGTAGPVMTTPCVQSSLAPVAAAPVVAGELALTVATAAVARGLSVTFTAEPVSHVGRCASTTTPPSATAAGVVRTSTKPDSLSSDSKPAARAAAAGESSNLRVTPSCRALNSDGSEVLTLQLAPHTYNTGNAEAQMGWWWESRGRRGRRTRT